jgi:hypothetical protein
MGNNSILATNASLYRKTGYDAAQDFAPISLIGSHICELRNASTALLSGIIHHASACFQ